MWTMEMHMTGTPRDAAQEELLQERLEFGRSLGLEEPVSLGVLHAALRDQTYAHNLRVSSRTPALLKVLLMNPPKLRQAPPFSTAEIAGRVAEALVRWTKTGFSVVDEATLERRRKACYSCPNLSTPPDQLVYKLTPAGGDICALCGCKINSKIRLPTESCPDRHPEREGETRWGEPRTV
jgi:hypothetical protein